LPEISDDFFNDFLSTATTKPPLPLPQKTSEENVNKPTKLTSNENKQQQQQNNTNSQPSIDELFADTSESPSSTQSSIKMQQTTTIIQKPQKREFDAIADRCITQQPPIKKSVLAQSRDAWSEFKDETGIDDELQSVNRGKQGMCFCYCFLLLRIFNLCLQVILNDRNFFIVLTIDNSKRRKMSGHMRARHVIDMRPVGFDRIVFVLEYFNFDYAYL
jgi:hypothetical protein